MHLFKVWTRDRKRKALIMVSQTKNIYTNLILQASTKLEIDGSRLVLESDGTPIDDEDEMLIALKPSTLILLTKHEIWEDPFNISSASTVTFYGGSETSTPVATPPLMTSITPTTTMTPTLMENEIFDFNAERDVTNNEVIVEIISEFSWINFEIPYSKIPQDMLDKCEAGIRDKDVTTHVVHVIINEMRNIKELIPAKALKIAANKLVQRYPKMFRDIDDDGVVIGDGSCTIFCKLQERSAYLRRPHKRSIAEVTHPVSSGTIKKRRNAMAGCSHWAPAKETEENLKSSKAFLQQTPLIIDANFYLHLSDSYAEQRAFLNNLEKPPTVKEIREEWPVLFQSAGIVWHFQKLTDINLNVLTTSIEEKSKKIVQFGVDKKIIKNIDKTNKYNEQSIEVFAKYFKEDITKFWYKWKDESQLNSNSIIINSPCIVEIENETSQFYVYMEKEKVVTCETFLEALKLNFGMYFIFNLEYPKQFSCVLETLQRYYLKMHPDVGGKSKKLSTTKKKVITLMNKLRDI